MAKYEVTCENGEFGCSFSGSASDLFALAGSIVVGMYNHMKKSEESGLIAETFKNACGNGILFDLADCTKTKDEQFIGDKIDLFEDDSNVQ